MDHLLILSLVSIFSSFLVNCETTRCSKLSENAAFQDQHTIVETTTKTLTGTWLSEGCETRPGPEYVLRHYSFQEDGKYKLIQHRYWDDSCSSPKLSFVSFGHIKTRRDSLLNHDALGGYIKPTNITIIPQDFKATQELNSIVSTHCPGRYWKSWRKYEEHVVYTSIKDLKHEPQFQNLHFVNFQETIQNNHDRNTLHHLHNSSGVIGCLGVLRWVFDELRLIKIQLRPNSYLFGQEVREMHWELLLGDTPSRQNLRDNYSPTAFQVPLVKITKGETVFLREKKFYIKYSCNICSNLLASERTPPHLIEKPRLPPYIWGDWVSERCEVRPLGLYLTRMFSFYNERLIWVGEHKFYLDPFCTLLKFVVTASGSFATGGPNQSLREASNIDFIIEKATLTIFNRNMLDYIPLAGCGEDPWKLGVSQELGLTGGCFALGIIIPSIQYDIIKVEMNYQGFWMLFLGQADTENLPRVANERPTAFQVPLIKCKDEKSEEADKGPYYDKYDDNVNGGCLQKFSIKWWIATALLYVLNTHLFLYL